MPRKRKLLAVTPLYMIPTDIQSGVISTFGGTKVQCQMCSTTCLLDPAIDADGWDVFYCIECSAKAGLTINEVVQQLVDGLSISYVRFLMLMEILKAEPGTRRYRAFVDKLRESGVDISDYPESESRL